MNIPVQFLFGYLVFIFFIFFISTYGGIHVVENLPPPPSFPPIPTSLSDVMNLLTFPFELLGYFYRFVFITSVNYPWLSIFLVPAAIIIALLIAMALIEIGKILAGLIPG